MIIFSSVQFKPPTLLGNEYPTWAQALGFMIVFVVLGWIPLWWIYLTVKELLAGNQLKTVIIKNLQPTKDWKPALEENQTGRYAPGYQQDSPWCWGFCTSVNHDDDFNNNYNNKVYPMEGKIVVFDLDTNETMSPQQNSTTLVEGSDNPAFEADKTVNL